MENQQTLSAICTECGLCCDGSLFSKVRIKDETDKQLVENLGMLTFESEGQLYFPQPCTSYTGTCSVYHGRPHTCQKFFCEPLRKANKGDISLEEATKKIKLAIQLRSEVKALASQHETLKNLSVHEINAYFKNEGATYIKQFPVLFMKSSALLIALASLRKKKE